MKIKDIKYDKKMMGKTGWGRQAGENRLGKCLPGSP